MGAYFPYCSKRACGTVCRTSKRACRTFRDSEKRGTSMKKRLDIRIEEDLRDGVERLSQQNGQTLTAVVERYVRDGLARDNGELVEQQSLPEIRKGVREEVHR